MDKLEKLRATIKKGDEIGALRMAANFKRPSVIISRAWAAYQNPSFYAQLGHDIAALIEAGIKEVKTM